MDPKQYISILEAMLLGENPDDEYYDSYDEWDRGYYAALRTALKIAKEMNASND